MTTLRNMLMKEGYREDVVEVTNGVMDAILENKRQNVKELAAKLNTYGGNIESAFDILQFEYGLIECLLWDDRPEDEDETDYDYDVESSYDIDDINAIIDSKLAE